VLHGRCGGKGQEVDQRAPVGRGRKGERALGLGTEGGWAERDPREEKEEEGEWAARERKGPAQGEEGKKSRLGCYWAGLSSLFPFLLSFFFSTLKLFKQIYLNSNKFEFEPYTLNTNKTMPQHECTNELTL
jgi:hypothetical protein